MKIPTATYRLQFKPSFGFQSAVEIVNYLKALGITHIYASPIFKVRKQSTHGYDAVDPRRLNPELGTMEDFETLVSKLKNARMGWIQDIVPNHLAYDFNNPALRDLLEHGQDSIYKDFFDIDWNPECPLLKGKLSAPFLGDHYEKCLSDGQLRLKYDEDGFSVNYYEFKLPLAISSYTELLNKTGEQFRQKPFKTSPAGSRLTKLINRLSFVYEKGSSLERDERIKSVKTQLWELYRREPDIAKSLNRILQSFNGDPGNKESFICLDNLLKKQVFRLRFWKTATDEINYRRFFDINDLISLRQESKSVFLWSHELVLRLIKDGKVDGLRIDHIDGLADPAAYLKRLKEKAGDTYTLVEKILGKNESLPESWSVQGTTGYEFSNRVEGLFVCNKNKEAMKSILSNQSIGNLPFEKKAVCAKREILLSHFAGELDRLVARMQQLAPYLKSGADITRSRLKSALTELLIYFPVYRTYTASGNPTAEESTFIRSANSLAVLHRPDLNYEFEFLQKILLNTHETLSGDKGLFQRLRKRAVTILEQLTAPLTAKGFEDTALYRYPLLLSLNEVGGDPDQFGSTRQTFHKFMVERAEKWPHALNTSSTHDSKRSEDIRARLNVLSEIPDQWEKMVYLWRTLNEKNKTRLKDNFVPDNIEEYFLYQTLVGSWPLNEDTSLPPYAERIEAYMVKALREAKLHSSWHSPNDEYEKAVKLFIRDILKPGEKNGFVTEFHSFCCAIAQYGIFNSLSQTLVKITAPGVPDFYQGAELINLNLVDPDNRRPIDYDKRKALLQKIQAAVAGSGLNFFPEPPDLLEQADRLKLFIIMKGLQTRKLYKNLYRNGSYLPLETIGRFSRHVVVFARRFENMWSITVVPRFLTRLIAPRQNPLGPLLWNDTAVILPPGAPDRWENVVDNRHLNAKNQLKVGELFEFFPAALLTGV